jgi:hypothetical protein
MNITMTLDQFQKIRRLLDFADFYLDDHFGASGLPEQIEQYESDKEEVLQAQEVLQDIDEQVHWLEEQERRSARTDAWIKQTNQDIERGLA